MTNKTTLSILVAIFAIALLAALAWFWSQRGATELVAPPANVAASAPVDTAAVAASAIAPAASEAPAVLFPVEPAASAASGVPATAAALDFGKALSELLGSKAVNEFFQTGDFARRFVATVDNLGRSHAPPSLWPINPTPGRFLINERDGKTVINASNAPRYTPLVRLIEAVDLKQAARLYARIYPLLQQAYEDIGYPKRYFNDRFVEVIDKLLATPEPTEPLQVQLTEVKGPVPSTRPWVRYEYVDPGYESLSSGQRILLRIGSDNRRRLKARLIEWRRELTHAPGPR